MNRILTTAVLFLLSMVAFGQEKHRFEDDVNTIRQYDKIYSVPDDPILFIGSSSIRKWDRLQSVFGTYNIVNRGIGGAVIDDITFYLNDLVFAYRPRQIVVYVGENDLPSTESPAEIFQKTKRLIEEIRRKLPEVPIVYIALKPSPSRDKFQQKCVQSNAMIRHYMEQSDNCTFVDVFTPMLKNGKSRPELFVKDMLHMNDQGYKIWEQLIQPTLKAR